MDLSAARFPEYARESIISALALIAGAAIGAVAAKYSGGGNIEYVKAGGTLFAATVRIFRLPALLCVFGCSIFGFFLIPVALASRGFMISYTVTLLIRGFSVRGFWTGAALYAVHNIFVLPCILVISAAGISFSRRIAGCVFGGNVFSQGGAVPFPGGRNFILKGIICIAALAAAALLEYFLTPALLALAIG